MSNKSFKVITTSRSDFKQKIKIPKKLMNPNTERLIKRTTVVGTLVAAYLLLTADYGPQPNVLDPIRNTILSAQRSVKESILGTKKKPEDSDARKCHLLYDSDFRKELQNVVDADDLAIILNSNHKPHCIIQLISQSLQMLKLDESKRTVLESKVSCLHDGIGVCDQIMGMPIPLSYTRLTSRFLVLWHLTLPIILWDDCHWIVVPATFISAASLFCIEEVGVLIEEPFPMLALDELCKNFCCNIQEAIATQKTIKAHVATKRKIHIHERSINGRPLPNGSKT